MAALAVTSMLTVTGFNDQVPILPESRLEWIEVVQYTASIALAFIAGNILAHLIFSVLPKIMARGGRPNVLAYKIAGALGQHVGEEQMRRRARTIQDLLTTVGPLAGVAATVGGSVYAGLKGVFGW